MGDVTTSAFTTGEKSGKHWHLIGSPPHAAVQHDCFGSSPRPRATSESRSVQPNLRTSLNFVSAYPLRPAGIVQRGAPTLRANKRRCAISIATPSLCGGGPFGTLSHLARARSPWYGSPYRFERKRRGGSNVWLTNNAFTPYDARGSPSHLAR